jgi:hypothetical protein
MQERNKNHDHWLVRPQTIRLLWIVSTTLLVLLVLLDLAVAHHPHFGLDGWFGFHAAYGFIACVVLVLLSKALGLILKRPDDYYGE